MARARRVPGIKPARTLRRNARKVIAVRLEELLSWEYALADPSLITELHDMRIAAKRLRYALEIFSICFPLKDALQQLTGLQEDLGTIHDLDVANDAFSARLHALDAAANDRAIQLMGGSASTADRETKLRSLLQAHAGDDIRIGLLGLIGEGTAERTRRFQHFVQTWNVQTLGAFASAVSTAAGLERHTIPTLER